MYLRDQVYLQGIEGDYCSFPRETREEDGLTKDNTDVHEKAAEDYRTGAGKREDLIAGALTTQWRKKNSAIRELRKNM